MDDIIRLKKNPMFSGYVIDEFNINQFLILEEEIENCKNCSGIDSCKNRLKGYKHSVEWDGNGYKFPISACRYYNTKKSLLKTKFMTESTKNASFDDFMQNTSSRKKAYSYAVSFLSTFSKENFVKGLFIYGKYGSGKTYFLTAMANALAEKGYSVLIAYFPDLVREIKGLQFKDGLEDVIDELKTVDILMLDDIGGENLSMFVRDDVLGPVLNYRVLNNLPVFFSSNLNIDDLNSHFSQTREDSFSQNKDEIKAARISKRITDLAVKIEFKDM